MELVTQIKAAWLVMGSGDFPLNPRLIGKPGVGKTTLAYHAARQLNQPVYLFQATIDTRPEDLIVTPVISDQGKIKYMASSIVTAMIKGGVAVIDEGNRMSEKSWASLAPPDGQSSLCGIDRSWYKDYGPSLIFGYVLP